jgi:hypothetical protein
MADQRIEARSILRDEHRRNRAIVGCVSPQSIHGFSREGDKRTIAQQRGGASDAVATGL